jgi:hypothetical protein
MVIETHFQLPYVKQSKHFSNHSLVLVAFGCLMSSSMKAFQKHITCPFISKFCHQQPIFLGIAQKKFGQQSSFFSHWINGQF